MMEVTVEGQYYSGSRNNKIARSYAPEKFLLNADTENPLHIIQRQLLNERLQKKYEDYTSWRTCRIIDQKEVGPEKTAEAPLPEIPIKTMTLDQLQRFVLLKKLPIDVLDFATVTEARKKVQDAWDDSVLLKQRDANEKAERSAKEAEHKNAETFREEPVDDLPTEAPARPRGRPKKEDPLAELE
jgi:hypothetical protein